MCWQHFEFLLRWFSHWPCSLWCKALIWFQTHFTLLNRSALALILHRKPNSDLLLQLVSGSVPRCASFALPAFQANGALFRTKLPVWKTPVNFPSSFMVWLDKTSQKIQGRNESRRTSIQDNNLLITWMTGIKNLYQNRFRPIRVNKEG